MSVFTIDDVLICVVEVVLIDRSRSCLVTQQRRQFVAIEILQQREKVRHEFCFSLHVMQTRVHGIALRRAAAIGSPQSRQMPYVPFLLRPWPSLSGRGA